MPIWLDFMSIHWLVWFSLFYPQTFSTSLMLNSRKENFLAEGIIWVYWWFVFLPQGEGSIPLRWSVEAWQNAWMWCLWRQRAYHIRRWMKYKPSFWGPNLVDFISFVYEIYDHGGLNFHWGCKMNLWCTYCEIVRGQKMQRILSTGRLMGQSMPSP